MSKGISCGALRKFRTSQLGDSPRCIATNTLAGFRVEALRFDRDEYLHTGTKLSQHSYDRLRLTTRQLSGRRK